ncbi:hypothetical protein L1987_22790 [Smallanthus sonchifolius]|uniref:Uncharacterized protein n=1 Tax=Smallanthus sonchifolius TaxID=185202 RepID=A0ACB9IFN7_9ASTR|nr:hypothetical protein L1987_22790 [Smallanthus sonchifolius]
MAENRKRVVVVVDQSIHSKHVMLWALTHVANQGDMLTLLHIHVNPNFNKEASRSCSSSSAPANLLVTSLGALCKACKPEHVEVEGWGNTRRTEARNSCEPSEEAGSVGACFGSEELVSNPSMGSAF